MNKHLLARRLNILLVVVLCVGAFIVAMHRMDEQQKEAFDIFCSKLNAEAAPGPNWTCVRKGKIVYEYE